MWFVLFAFQVLDMCLIATATTCFMLLFHDLVVATCHWWGRFATSTCVQSVMFSVSKRIWASVSPLGNDEEMSAALLGWFGCFVGSVCPPFMVVSLLTSWKIHTVWMQQPVCDVKGDDVFFASLGFLWFVIMSIDIFVFVSSHPMFMQGRVHSMSSRRTNQRQSMTKLSKTSLATRCYKQLLCKLYTLPWWLITRTMRNFSMSHCIQKLLVLRHAVFVLQTLPEAGTNWMLVVWIGSTTKLPYTSQIFEYLQPWKTLDSVAKTETKNSTNKRIRMNKFCIYIYTFDAFTPSCTLNIYLPYPRFTKPIYSNFGSGHHRMVMSASLPGRWWYVAHARRLVQRDMDQWNTDDVGSLVWDDQWLHIVTCRMGS